MKEKELIAIARAKLPLAVQALNAANLEVQRTKPDMGKLNKLLNDDDLMGYFDVSELVSAYNKLASLTPPRDTPKQQEES